MTVIVGMRPPRELFDADAAHLRRFVATAEDSGIDRLCVGDHVTFQGGQGFDAMVHATALAVTSSRVSIQTAVYLLPLRHPVPVARQIVSLAALAPGRFVFGAGIGGEDRREVAACGVDPATRGRRMDESLAVVRQLLRGETVTAKGGFFDLDEVAVRPAPDPQVPMVVGGRSASAVRRVARLADGWLAVWVSPRRFAEVTGQVAEQADEHGRGDVRWQHGLHVWCGFGRDKAEATSHLAPSMEALYRTPFSAFERYSPCGMPEQVAAQLMPYVEAGCREINLIPVAADLGAALDGTVRVRELLREWTTGAGKEVS
ncbi:LLM class flavin-dependent oxidoreductase [Yinghuangia sp. ASG 101]|uniref:LLM class flavin-dependent oxidoreductase n=1 Tax=Yinghuangia sp. ASG 101 TaxID=2896848 RepID=UPI001E2D3687|nr:LLM class flavin-dependent oxidoreductase [Yinghuangia sp. ASG 101]UGQ11211.1 LLM class flavin-dependent oxidoreductase [Yinghuangia sp. ASG 101]